MIIKKLIMDPVINSKELEQEDQITNNAITKKTKKEWRLKLCMHLSTRYKIEWSYEIKRLIAKIANPSEEKNEYIDQCIHIAEDVLNTFCKMKDTKAKLISNNVFEINSCGVSQETYDSVIDNQLLLILDEELLNSMCNKVQKRKY